MNTLDLFGIYTGRYDKLKTSIHGADIDSLADTRDGRRLLYNLAYAGLGTGTLLLRLGTIIQLSWYIRNIFPENPDPAINRLIIEKMRDKPISDGDWKELWMQLSVACKGSVHPVVSSLALIPAADVDKFVKVRNRVVHPASGGVRPEEWEDIIVSIEAFVVRVDLFDATRIMFNEIGTLLEAGDFEALSLDPFVKAGGNEDLLLFQGIGRDVLKYLNGHTGEVQESSVESLYEYFREIEKKAGAGEFISRFDALIEDYTSLFVGRERELAAVREFLDSDENVISITSEAGYGKSALLANAVSALRSNPELNKRFSLLAHFCGAGSANDPVSIIGNLLKQDPNAWNTLPGEQRVSRGTTLPYDFEKLVERFQQQFEWYGSSERSTKTLIVVIDGLEESVLSSGEKRIDSIFLKKGIEESEGEEGKIEKHEITRDWQVPAKVKFILGYRVGSLVQAPAGWECELLQPLRALDEGAVDSAFSARPLSPEVRSRVIEHGRPFGSTAIGEVDPSFLRLFHDAVMEGRASVNNPATVPAGLSGVYLEKLEGLRRRDYDAALRVLGYCAISVEPISIAFLEKLASSAEQTDGGIVSSNAVSVEDVVNILPKWFKLDEMKRLSLYHDRLKQFVLSLVAGSEQVEMHKRFCEIGLQLVRGNNEEKHSVFTVEIYRYMLRNLPHHLVLSGEDDRAFDLVMDDTFRNRQLDEFMEYDPMLDSMVGVLKNELRRVQLTLNSKNIPESERTSRLVNYCRITLACGEMGHKAQNDISIAFQWAQEGKLEDALRRISVIRDEKRLFMAHFLVLWYVCDRDAADEERRMHCDEVLKAIDERISASTGTLKFGDDHYIGISIGAHVVMECFRLTGRADALISRMVDEKKKDLISTVIELYHIRGTSVLEATMNILSNIDQAYDNSSALSGIAEALARAGENEKAKDVCDLAIKAAGEYDDADKKFSVLTGIAEALAQAGENEKARELIEHALLSAGGIDDAFSKSWAISVIAGALVQLREQEKAKEVFEHALVTAEDINRMDYKSKALSSIAGWLAQAGEKEKAKEVIERAMGITGEINLAHIRSIALSDNAKGLAMVGEIERALVVAGELDPASLKRRTMTLIAGWLAQAGEKEKAKDVFGRALGAAEEIDDAWGKSEALSGIAVGLANAGEKEKAKEVCSLAFRATAEIRSVEVKSSALSGIAEALARAGEKEKAKDICGLAFKAAGEYDDADIKCSVLTGISEALAQAGEKEKASELFKHALVEAGKIDDANYKSNALSDIAVAFSRTGKFELALETAGEIDHAYDKSRALSDIAKALAQSCESEGRIGLFERALVVAREINRAEYKSDALSAIAGALAQVGNKEKAKYVYKLALVAAGEINRSYIKSLTLSDIAGSLASAGEFESALAVANEIDGALHAGVFEHSLVVAGDVDPVYDKSCALSSIARALAQGGEKDKAKEIFEYILGVVGEINRESSRSEALSIIAGALAQAGKFEGRSELFERTLIAIGEINLAEYKSAAMSGIGEAFALSGDKEKAKGVCELALGIAREIDNAGDKSRALSSIARALALAGEFKISLEITEEIDNVGDKSRALSDIARALAQAKESIWPIFERWVAGATNLQTEPYRVMKKVWIGSLRVSAGRTILPYVIRVLSWLPLDAESSAGGVFKLMEMLIELRRFDAASAVSSACPQLGLADIYEL